MYCRRTRIGFFNRSDKYRLFFDRVFTSAPETSDLTNFRAYLKNNPARSPFPGAPIDFPETRAPHPPHQHLLLPPPGLTCRTSRFPPRTAPPLSPRHLRFSPPTCIRLRPNFHPLPSHPLCSSRRPHFIRLILRPRPLHSPFHPVLARPHTPFFKKTAKNLEAPILSLPLH